MKRVDAKLISDVLERNFFHYLFKSFELKNTFLKIFLDGSYPKGKSNSHSDSEASHLDRSRRSPFSRPDLGRRGVHVR